MKAELAKFEENIEEALNHRDWSVHRLDDFAASPSISATAKDSNWNESPVAHLDVHKIVKISNKLLTLAHNSSRLHTNLALLVLSDWCCPHHRQEPESGTIEDRRSEHSGSDDPPSMEPSRYESCPRSLEFWKKINLAGDLKAKHKDRHERTTAVWVAMQE